MPYFTALHGTVVLFRNIRATKNLVIGMIFSATFFFLFQIICISISLLNHFICDIFKYAVLESKTNYKIKYILLSSPLSFIIYLKNSWLSISADFHKVHCIVYYKLCEVLLFHFLTYCYKNKRKMPQSSHAMNKINPHHELAGQSGSVNTALTYIQNPFP